MSSLASVLQKHTQLRLGESVAAEPASTLDPKALRDDLQSIVVKSDRFLWIWVATLAILFAIDCFVLFRDMNSPRLVGAIFTATGVGFVTILTQLRRIWHEKFMTQTLIALLPALGPVEIKNVALQILAALQKS
jgi:hypothetical protein